MNTEQVLLSLLSGAIGGFLGAIVGGFFQVWGLHLQRRHQNDQEKRRLYSELSAMARQVAISLPGRRLIGVGLDELQAVPMKAINLAFEIGLLSPKSVSAAAGKLIDAISRAVEDKRPARDMPDPLEPSGRIFEALGAFQSAARSDLGTEDGVLTRAIRRVRRVTSG